MPSRAKQCPGGATAIGSWAGTQHRGAAGGVPVKAWQAGTESRGKGEARWGHKRAAAGPRHAVGRYCGLSLSPTKLEGRGPRQGSGTASFQPAGCQPHKGFNQKVWWAGWETRGFAAGAVRA